MPPIHRTRQAYSTHIMRRISAPFTAPPSEGRHLTNNLTDTGLKFLDILTASKRFGRSQSGSRRFSFALSPAGAAGGFQRPKSA